MKFQRFLPFVFLTLSFFQVRGQGDTYFDFSNYNFKDSIAEVEGEVLFYWNKLHTLKDVKTKKLEGEKISIFHSWDNQPSNFTNHASKGFGTYYFKLKIPENEVGKQFIIRPKHFIAYASEFYINDEMVCHNGSVGVSKKDKNYQPSRNTNCTTFTADSSIIDVIVWVANFDHFRGGIFRTIEFGLADNMMQKREREITFDLLIIISLFIMFLYHIVWYFVNRKEQIALFFSLTCLIFAVDFSFQNTMTFFLFFPNVGFQLSSFLHLSMPYLLPPSFIFFLHTLFPNEVSRRLRNLTGFIGLVLPLLTFLFGSVVTSTIVKPHLAYTFILILYIYYVAIKALKNKREGATLFIIAYLIFSICAINDILFVYEFIHTASLVSTGLIVFVLSLSIIQGRRMVLINNRNIKLSTNLKELNINLEKKVEERTAELNKTIVELKKLSLFKEDMTNMLVHDLKSPLSALINVDKISKSKNLIKLIKLTGRSMLSLVQNILDVYRYENAEFNLNKKDVDLIQVLNRAVDEFDFILDQKNLTITIPTNVKCRVIADAEILNRIFSNILSNAVKFAPKNSTINVSFTKTNPKNVKIGISNNGPGIPKKMHELIFRKFGYLDEPSNNSNATGLGLAFCKIAVEAHDGEIGVISESETGVEFWFTLPNANFNNTIGATKKYDTLNNSALTQEDKKYLLPVCKHLKSLKVFEITAINIHLSTVNVLNDRIKRWLNNLEYAIFSGDQDNYNELLNEIIQNDN